MHFYPIMPFYGKRMSRQESDSDYKSDEESASNNIKMPHATANIELTESLGQYQPGDKIFGAKPFKSIEEIPDDWRPCFEPEGRPGLGERLSTLEDEMAEMKNLYKGLLADEFANDMVQLEAAMEHANILDLHRAPRQILKRKSLRYQEVMSKMDSVSQSKLKADGTYKEMNRILKSSFKKVVEARNQKVHSGNINLGILQAKVDFIGLGLELSEEDRLTFNRAKSGFEKMKKLKKFKKYVNIYNKCR